MLSYAKEHWVLSLVLIVGFFLVLAFKTMLRTDDNISKGIHPLTGIVGWAYILAAITVLEPIRHAYIIIYKLQDMIEKSVIAVLPELFSQNFGLFAYIIIFEMIMPILMLGVFCYIAYLFFKRKKLFIDFSIVVAWSYLLLWSIVIIIRSLLIPKIHIFDSANIYSFIGGLIWAYVWVAYLKKSERVKINFTQ